MCGIFIIKSKRNPNKYLNQFKASLNDLYSRGPDSKKYLKKQNYLIGFTRLSINDLKNANQPFESEDKRFTLLFNGEILNYKILIDYLASKQVVLKKYTEAEVILKLYILYKEKFLEYLKGFFAIVIIDHKTNKIFACVDQFSVKPLYYYRDKDLLIFCSNLSPILNNKIIKKNYNYKELINFITLGRELNNKTIYQNINKLKASTYSIFFNERVTTHKYWSPFQKNISLNHDYNKIIENDLDRVTDLWKTSDVELSNTRSNGVDSNILNFFFKKNNIKTTNFLIKEQKNHNLYKNESYVSSDSVNIEYEFDKYLKNNLDPTPIGASSSLAFFSLYKNISQKNFKVCFNGEGADELFGGYPRYLKHLNLINLRKGDLYKSFLDLYSKEIKLSQYSVKKNGFSVYDHLLNQIKKIKINSKSNLNKILEFDQITWVPSVIKRHDAIGMFYSLEIRPPFLDQDLVNIANNLPDKLKIDKKEQKVILKTILSKRYNFEPSLTKMGTPSYFNKLISSKINRENLKEKIFYGELSKIYDPIKTWEICSKQLKEKSDHIFLWKIFVLTKIFEYN